MPTFWDILKEEDKEKLRALMPPDWKPPTSKDKKVEIESLSELAYIMSQKPGSKRKRKNGI